MTEAKKIIEEIKHAAVISETGMIFLGKCHADCFAKMDNVGLNPMHMAQAQGFFTNHGRYVNREKAASIALLNGQVNSCDTILCSEDLWSKESCGQHNYCEIRGYYK
jgi:membrane peptidoglycan carboxypeptidase